ncbi:hypothetical protein [Shinella pollutisoli]|uniref:Uncharacterized protein n=1 Tax=Shinella pollutisoli TaxID=2250594 RepID=A0ABV7DIY5_9HYPH|nr:hypothetical protein [Shinella pollutisoli]
MPQNPVRFTYATRPVEALAFVWPGSSDLSPEEIAAIQALSEQYDVLIRADAASGNLKLQGSNGNWSAAPGDIVVIRHDTYEIFVSYDLFHAKYAKAASELGDGIPLARPEAPADDEEDA